MGNGDAIAEGGGSEQLAFLEQAEERGRINGTAPTLPLVVGGQEGRHLGQNLALRRARERGDDGLGREEI